MASLDAFETFCHDAGAGLFFALQGGAPMLRFSQRFVLSGVACALLVAVGLLAWPLATGSSGAQSGTIHNCPPAGKWSIAVWQGTSGTAAGDALAACGGGSVAAAYSLDSQTGAWSRWFAGKPDVSNLPPLNDMQGVLALGSATTPQPTATLTPTATPATCIPSGDQTAINNALTSVGSKAALCQNAVFNLTAPVVFTEANQEIYTEGFPAGSERAELRVAGSNLAMAVNGLNESGVKLRNVVVDGNRPGLGHLAGGDELILIGGDASGQVVDHVKIYEPRGWSCLHLIEGGNYDCTGAVITNNEIGPAGQSDGTWADGISLACRNSTVSSNTITDATDGAIVVFGSPGSLISDNTIRAVSRTLFGGINMVDYTPSGGDYTGTLVTGNTIDAAGAHIVTGIAMGPRVWSCPTAEWPAGPNRGGSVTNNTLTGAYMGYGFVVDGVENWTVTGNVSDAVHSGTPAGGCGETPAAPAAFQKHGVHATGSFQPEFEEAYVESVGLSWP
jgi:parallel beta-helix repeat protein